jgi:hypothetical protein
MDENMNDRLEYLQQNYPGILPAQLRRFVKYMNAGLPEEYWVVNKHDNRKVEFVDMMKTNLNKNKNCIVFFNDVDKQQNSVASLTKANCDNAISCFWISHYILMGDLIGKFGDIKANEIYKTMMDKYRYIFISNIRGGNVYQKNEEHFTLFMENFLYPLRQCNFILSFDYVKKDERENIYGSLYSLMKSSNKVVEIG